MCLSICKSLVVVLEHRKVSCLCAWAYEISCLRACNFEITLLVKSPWKCKGTWLLPVCGRNLYNCFVSLFSLPYSVFIRCTFSLWPLLQKLIVICFWTVTSVGETKKKKTQFNPPFLCFSHLQKSLRSVYFLPVRVYGIVSCY